ncbi:lycopene cyclase family protein [Flavobacterium urocaniciphilum]|uniref:Lycopene beta-cyclase n=1 Tax=Flavobacterium urocaniciphilum TaxID=1299341 RepID=A0A1H9E1V6_9FLAO|nr:lycopene cyclase family protein [Flavobacterium urocaniciphilum]SEQ19664.1 lycopene beta-cyclase [Flavobacterium urocaniciphilum]
MNHYHYIFTGGGLSALLTLFEMIQSGRFSDKKILLIDSSSKDKNDRTWCFWDTENLFDEIISKKWNIAWFKNESFTNQLNLSPYEYKMIRSLDFYKLIFEAINKHPNIEIFHDDVIDYSELGNHCIVKTKTKSFTCNQIFNSIYNPEVVTSQTKFPLVQQHFIGWFIKSKEAVFTEDCPTFMDFSVEQKGNTRFMYVLPTSSNEALLEYTLFSKDLLSTSEYESEIEKYIQQLGITEYEIVEKEQGTIPMTCFPFWKNNTKNIINIGSAGGWSKASTGYTFKNSVKKSKELVQFLKTNSDFTKFYKSNKFRFYDLLLIDILYQTNQYGSAIFSSMFKTGKAALIFKFLDEETSFWEDLKVIWMCPKGLFIKALLRRIF